MRALIRELQASPDDERLWLVFADALLERGDVRGELITLSHRLEHESLSIEQIDAIRWRIEEIEQANRWVWQQEIAGLPPATARWKAGFVVGIRLDWTPAARDALAAWLDHPAGALVRGLEFVNESELGNGGATRLAHWSELEHLTDLGLRRTALGSSGASRLAASPHLAGVTRLDLRGNHVQAEGLRAIAESRETLVHLDVGYNLLRESAGAVLGRANLEALASLDLSHNRIGTDGVRLLAASDSLRGLRALELGMNQVDDDGARALAHANWWGQLETLTLSHNQLGDKGVAALASVAAPSLRMLRLKCNDIGPLGAQALEHPDLVGQLVHLDLRWNRLGAGGAEALAAAAPGELRTLVLDRNEIGDAGLRALSRSPLMVGLSELCIGRNHIGDRGIQALAQAPCLQLRSLNLWHNDLGAMGAKALADCPSLAFLAHLDLGGNRIGSEGVTAIARSTSLTRLSSLELWHAGVGDAGAEALSAAPMERLAHLDLTYNFISDRGARAIARAPWLGHLATLDLRRNDLGPEGREALRRAAKVHPDLRVMM